MAPSTDSVTRRRWLGPLGGLILALAAWSLYLAAGPLVNGDPRGAAKAALILGCMAAFLGMWGLLLWSRQRRRRPHDSPTDAPPPGRPADDRPGV